jgi:hypothetical protein
MADEWLNWLKIAVAVGTVLTAIICGTIVIKKNPNYWLNRFFTAFYLSGAIGFLFYTIYHIYGINKGAIIPLMISGHVFMNLGLSCLLQTEFILEHSSKEAMTFPYLALSAGLFLISCAGYFFRGIVILDDMEYANKIIDTHTNTYWQITVNLYRLGVFLFIIIKYTLISKKAEGVTIKKLKIFTSSLIIAMVGIVLNLAAGVIFNGYTEYSFEILGMLTFMIGLIVMIRAFLLKERVEPSD